MDIYDQFIIKTLLKLRIVTNLYLKNMDTKISDIEIASKLLNLRNSASTRNIEFDLTFNKVKQIMNTKRCYFTGVKLIQGNKDNLNDYNVLSFDRIDNSIGYIDSNVVACSQGFNKIKGNLSVIQIKQLYAGLLKKKVI